MEAAVYMERALEKLQFWRAPRLISSQRVRSRSRKPEKFGIPKEAAVWHRVISSDMTELCKFGFDIHLLFQILGALGFGNDQLNRDAPCFTQDPLFRSQVQFFIDLNASKISATETRWLQWLLCFVCFVSSNYPFAFLLRVKVCWYWWPAAFRLRGTTFVCDLQEQWQRWQKEWMKHQRSVLENLKSTVLFMHSFTLKIWKWSLLCSGLNHLQHEKECMVLGEGSCSLDSKHYCILYPCNWFWLYIFPMCVRAFCVWQQQATKKSHRFAPKCKHSDVLSGQTGEISQARQCVLTFTHKATRYLQPICDRRATLTHQAAEYTN